jgi:hypothetical protein
MPFVGLIRSAFITVDSAYASVSERIGQPCIGLCSEQTLQGEPAPGTSYKSEAQIKLVRCA